MEEEVILADGRGGGAAGACGGLLILGEYYAVRGFFEWAIA